jgi:hypothetical protein
VPGAGRGNDGSGDDGSGDDGSGDDGDDVRGRVGRLVDRHRRVDR